jgi:lipopolysaccharide transport system ATP-binding protein
MQIAVHASGLGKQYRIRAGGRHNTLRDAIASTFRWGSGGKTAAAGRSNGDPDWFWALRDIEFDVAQGEAIGIIGANGAGKSTLLKVLSRVTEPTTGEVVIRGRVGSLLEVGTGFHSELTGRENTFLSGAILGMRRSEIERKFDEIVEFAEIERFIDTPVKHYSSGMYLRLAFAVAAHLEPEILIVDEVHPVGDAELQPNCLGKMHEITQADGRTIFFVSHNLAAVQNLCERCLLLERGRLVATGPPDAIVHRYLTSDESDSAPGQWVWGGRVKRRGSGTCRFTGIRYTSGEAGVAGHPLSEAPLEVEVAIDAAHPTEIGRLAVVIYDYYGTKLISADVCRDAEKLRLSAGRNLLQMEIEVLHLNPGLYRLGFVLADEVGAYLDLIDTGPEFQVVAGGSEPRGTADGLVPCSIRLVGRG